MEERGLVNSRGRCNSVDPKHFVKKKKESRMEERGRERERERVQPNEEEEKKRALWDIKIQAKNFGKFITRVNYKGELGILTL
ncbi:hypothetical protein LOK49_LG12G01165 [Camellia lanceoleosa]|uniref:Uncharacterized protein n=1 Tax=Camellia lanceoleosa TaxID=1840588 RepID=A0ACC0FUS5_9ERIC|nr:hypothetical protein LOK49_LG12G01165 [Camellia lanceoleosa]